MERKKMITILGTIIGVLLLILIIVMLVVGLGNKNKTLSYNEIEAKILTAMENYYSDNKAELPLEGTKTLSISTLVANGYLNDLSTYTAEGVTCSGMGYVTNIANNYSYRVVLTCSDGSTSKVFSDYLKENVVSAGAGLYEMQQVSIDNNLQLSTNYVYRGETVNNYVKIGDFRWRIVKINDKNEVVLIETEDVARSSWDDRYNIETNQYRGINNYNVSRVKEYITQNILEPVNSYSLTKKLITSHDVCIGKRSTSESSINGVAECSNVLENQYFSLLPIYDYMSASLDVNCNSTYSASCSNYNYLSAGDEWWTVTALSDSTEDVYYVSGSVGSSYASSTKDIRLVVALDSMVSYVSGSGTYNDPYIVK